jgi:hypothetical protein
MLSSAGAFVVGVGETGYLHKDMDLNIDMEILKMIGIDDIRGCNFFPECI